MSSYPAEIVAQALKSAACTIILSDGCNSRRKNMNADLFHVFLARQKGRLEWFLEP